MGPINLAVNLSVLPARRVSRFEIGNAIGLRRDAVEEILGNGWRFRAAILRPEGPQHSSPGQAKRRPGIIIAPRIPDALKGRNMSSDRSPNR